MHSGSEPSPSSNSGPLQSICSGNHSDRQQKKVRHCRYTCTSKQQYHIFNTVGVSGMPGYTLHSIKVVICRFQTVNFMYDSQCTIQKLYYFLCLHRLFFRRHYPINTVTFSSIDPQDQRWVTKAHQKQAQALWLPAVNKNTSAWIFYGFFSLAEAVNLCVWCGCTNLFILTYIFSI